MAKRIILTEENGLLRETSKEVRDFGEALQVLLDDLHETMLEAGGVGIAAPQVGVLRRVFIMLKSPNDDEKEVFEFINPEIVKFSGESIEKEGCLSVPGKNGLVARPRKITIKAQDRNGVFFEMKCKDAFLCSVISHELDHLNGILFIDKIVEKKRGKK